MKEIMEKETRQNPNRRFDFRNQHCIKLEDIIIGKNVEVLDQFVFNKLTDITSATFESPPALRAE